MEAEISVWTPNSKPMVLSQTYVLVQLPETVLMTFCVVLPWFVTVMIWPIALGGSAVITSSSISYRTLLHTFFTTAVKKNVYNNKNNLQVYMYITNHNHTVSTFSMNFFLNCDHQIVKFFSKYGL